MEVEEIKRVVLEGRTVHWRNRNFVVVLAEGHFKVKYLGNGNSVYLCVEGLSDRLTYWRKEDYYIKCKTCLVGVPDYRGGYGLVFEGEGREPLVRFKFCPNCGNRNGGK